MSAEEMIRALTALRADAEISVRDANGDWYELDGLHIDLEAGRVGFVVGEPA